MGRRIFLRATRGNSVDVGYAGRGPLSASEALLVQFDADMQPEKIARALQQMAALVATRKVYKMADQSEAVGKKPVKAEVEAQWQALEGESGD